jgi:hypothetical protein
MTASAPITTDDAEVFDLDSLTHQLDVIADWKDDLRSRSACADLRFELIGLDEEEQDQLVREVEDFKSGSSQLRVAISEWRGERKLELRECTRLFGETFFTAGTRLTIDIGKVPELIRLLSKAVQP